MAYTSHGSASGSRLVNTILDDGWRWRSGPASEPTEIFVHLTTYKKGPAGLRGWERSAFWEAMEAWEQVANVDFRYSRFLGAADVALVVDNRKAFPGRIPDSVLAFQDGPYGARGNDGMAVGGYFRDNRDWTVAGTRPGGEAFGLILHELGHALGLAHPFDSGPSGKSPIGLGETEISVLATAMAYAPWRFDDRGYTSFHGVAQPDGWWPADRSHLVTPSPLDIAAIQHLYGANLDQDDGDGDGSPNDTYWLPNRHKAGIGWTTIWDTGGVDWIRHAGERDSRISLEPFRFDKGLRQEVAGQAEWIRGGLMIAGDFTGALGRGQGVSGVVIENASGGSGEDRITGNAAANVLRGNAGWDVLEGRGGDDLLRGGAGEDELRGGGGNDRLYGDADDDLLLGGDGDDELYGGVGDDVLSGGKGRDRLEGGAWSDTLTGGAWKDRFVFRAGDGHDTITDFRGDVIDLRWHERVSSFDALMETARQGRNEIRLYLGDEDSITLKGLRLADLSPDDFLI